MVLQPLPPNPDPPATEILVYQNVIAFLSNACPQTSQNADEVQGVQRTLDGYLLSMSSESLVGAIVNSLRHRTMLLELCSQLGLANDPTLRAALRTDGERLAAHLVSIFESNSLETTALGLEGDSAQCFIDAVQDALDKGFLMAHEQSSKARRIIRKLSESCDKLPTSLFIIGVDGREEHPTFGGGFGDIYRASYNCQVVALKHMRHFLRGTDLRRIREKFCREALLWKDLHHPHTLTFIGIDRESFPSSLCMVSPWMEHGTILNYLNAHGRANIGKLLFEVAQGLEYLHSNDIVHGDLRGANILINQDWSACLADFGLSGFSDATANQTSSKRAGSIYWMAPELLAPEQFKTRFTRTPASDVYAFACVCLELYTGHPPFSELSEVTAMLKIIAGERAKQPSDGTLPDPLWQDVTSYWAQDPTVRPISKAVVQNMIRPAAERKNPVPFPIPDVRTFEGFHQNGKKSSIPPAHELIRSTTYKPRIGKSRPSLSFH